jgi:hypothetical protein
MRKQTTNSGSEAVSRSGDVWLDLERLARSRSSQKAPNIIPSSQREIVREAVPTRRWRNAGRINRINFIDKGGN